MSALCVILGGALILGLLLAGPVGGAACLILLWTLLQTFTN